MATSRRRRLVAIALPLGIGTLLLLPGPGRSEVTGIAATRIFTTSSQERAGLAFDPASEPEALHIADTSAQLRSYALDGTLLGGPLVLPGNGRGDLGLHFLRETASIGEASAPAGTLIFIQAGLANDPDQTTLYALDAANASVVASQALATDFNTGSCRPLRDRAHGLGYSTPRQIFLSYDFNCLGGGLGEVGADAVTGFLDDPSSHALPDVKEHPDTGLLWLGGGALLTELSPAGDLLREFSVFDADTEQAVTIVGMAFDATGDRLWLLSFDGDVYEIGGDALLQPGVNVPAVGPWGALPLVLVLAGVLMRTSPRDS